MCAYKLKAVVGARMNNVAIFIRMTVEVSRALGDGEA